MQALPGVHGRQPPQTLPHHLPHESPPPRQRAFGVEGILRSTGTGSLDPKPGTGPQAHHPHAQRGYMELV